MSRLAGLWGLIPYPPLSSLCSPLCLSPSPSPPPPVLLCRNDNVTCGQSAPALASMLHGQNRLCLSGAPDEQFLQGVAFGCYVPSLWQKTD